MKRKPRFLIHPEAELPAGSAQPLFMPSYHAAWFFLLSGVQT